LLLHEVSYKSAQALQGLAAAQGLSTELLEPREIAVTVPEVTKTAAAPPLEAGKWYWAEAKEDVYPFVQPRAQIGEDWEVDLLTASNAIPTRQVLSTEELASYGLRPATEDDFSAMDLPVPLSQQLVQAATTPEKATKAVPEVTTEPQRSGKVAQHRDASLRPNTAALASFDLRSRTRQSAAGDAYGAVQEHWQNKAAGEVRCTPEQYEALNSIAWGELGYGMRQTLRGSDQIYQDCVQKGWLSETSDSRPYWRVYRMTELGWKVREQEAAKQRRGQTAASTVRETGHRRVAAEQERSNLRLSVDYARPCDEWWDNGGAELWERWAVHDPKGDSVVLSAEEYEIFKSEAAEIAGYFECQPLQVESTTELSDTETEEHLGLVHKSGATMNTRRRGTRLASSDPVTVAMTTAAKYLMTQVEKVYGVGKVDGFIGEKDGRVLGRYVVNGDQGKATLMVRFPSKGHPNFEVSTYTKTATMVPKTTDAVSFNFREIASSKALSAWNWKPVLDLLAKELEEPGQNAVSYKGATVVAPQTAEALAYAAQLGETHAKSLARQGLRPSAGSQQIPSEDIAAFENHMDRDMTSEDAGAWRTGFSAAAAKLFRSRSVGAQLQAEDTESETLAIAEVKKHFGYSRCGGMTAIRDPGDPQAWIVVDPLGEKIWNVAFTATGASPEITPLPFGTAMEVLDEQGIRLVASAKRGPCAAPVLSRVAAPARTALPEQTEMPLGKDYREWPIYSSEQQKEKEQVEAVFHLGGGELEDEPWGGYAYWYEGAPEYAADDVDQDSGTYRTVIVDGGGYLSQPKETITDADGHWKLVNTYVSSGETDCTVCGSGMGDLFTEGFYEEYGEEPRPSDRCGLCENLVKDMPGYIYIGEGYEAVYQLVEEAVSEDPSVTAATRHTAAMPDEFWVDAHDLCAFYGLSDEEAGLYVDFEVRVHRNGRGGWSVEPMDPHAELLDSEWAPKSDQQASELYLAYGHLEDEI
jgi:hypothetical protein